MKIMITDPNIKKEIYNFPKDYVDQKKVKVCAGCKQLRKIVGSYYSQPACIECADEYNEKLQTFRKNWDEAFERYYGQH